MLITELLLFRTSINSSSGMAGDRDGVASAINSVKTRSLKFAVLVGLSTRVRVVSSVEVLMLRGWGTPGRIELGGS